VTPTERVWEFWIDRGGTFTDCIAISPQGAVHTAKVLSSDDAPVEAVRAVLEQVGGPGGADPLPRCRVGIGSTVATNALLERRGVPTVLVADGGLGDLLAIGTQQRPDLFALAIERPPPLPERVVEVGGRRGADGSVRTPFDPRACRAALRAARRAGATSLAVSLAHAYAYPELEEEVAELASDLGFEHVVRSHEIANELGLLARTETTVADGYLTPLLRRHTRRLAGALPGSRLRFMQSSGGRTDAARFRGPSALLSGPAGGVIAAARVAARAGFAHAIGFDMGGTSTDVSLVRDGEVERAYESVVGGVRVKSPMLRIHTVAAGGGSLCRFDGFRSSVGPESAGAWPGPLCYGRADAEGRPVARELAITDVNHWLGRIQPDRFPFPLARAPVERALDEVRDAMRAEGFERSRDEVAAGFVEVANAAMAQAIQEVSVARGVDPREHVLVGFGGAGGQHACAIARALGIGTVLLHPLAGLLSAYGIGIAEESWDGQRDAGRVPLESGLPDARRLWQELEEEGRAALEREGIAPADVRVDRSLDLRVRGADTSLTVAEPAADAEASAWTEAFRGAHRDRFGYVREDATLEIVTARLRAHAPGSEPPPLARPAPPAAGDPAPRRRESVWLPGLGRHATGVFAREDLVPGQRLDGPALIVEDTGTVVVEPGFALEVDAEGVLVLRDREGPARAAPDDEDLDVPDPVRLEVLGQRFASIAEQMGAVLRNTAVSTNIKDRLDYSCAVFDAAGGLVANAPHIPVHLGAMGETVASIRGRFPELAEGDVFVTNDPYAGGSHLPDVTVVTPVFEAGRAAFFTASRGHHAEIGGVTPGSMPPASRTLEEEGVVLPPMHLVRSGELQRDAVRRLLCEAPYPSRRPDDNLADLEAMVAANRAGARLLAALVAEQGLPRVATGMRQLQDTAAAKVAREIGRLPDGEHRFADALDDGTPVVVTLTVSGERMIIDFAGTGPAVPGNLNAPRAVVQAAVLYVLRSLVDARLPLNGGCLEPVEVRVPPGSLLDPPPGRAVVGGNVETSQRIVDVLLGALGRVAASQGTMNNVTFGNADFGYYETIGGGTGAGEGFDGASGVHSHMTNTRITDAEILESRYPVWLRAFRLREGSGGAGTWRGGDGLVRRYRFDAPVTVSLLTERRTRGPWGLRGGADGAPGRNRVRRRDGSEEQLPARARVELAAGDELIVETPGGGGFGAPGALPAAGSEPKVPPGA